MRSGFLHAMFGLVFVYISHNATTPFERLDNSMWAIGCMICATLWFTSEKK